MKTTEPASSSTITERSELFSANLDIPILYMNNYLYHTKHILSNVYHLLLSVCLCLIMTGTAVPAQAQTITPGDSANFVTVWKTDNPGSTDDNQIRIPTTGTGYNYSIYWENEDDPSQSDIVSGITGTYTLTFPAPGTYRVEIQGDFPRIFFYNGGDRRKIMEVRQWGGIAWESMANAFNGASHLQVTATDRPDLSQVTDMSYMFYGANKFNADISHWDVSNVTTMNYTFFGAISFDQPLSNWNVSKVEKMDLMFWNATSFNQPLNDWDVSNATTMVEMFRGATSFNQHLNDWDVSKVGKMKGMFRDATSFNQTLNDWDVSNVTTMSYMFSGASSFDQQLSNWDVSRVTDMESMFDESALSLANYDATLIGWASREGLQSGVQLGALGINYCSAEQEWQKLVTDKEWDILDDGKHCAGPIKPGIDHIVFVKENGTGNGSSWSDATRKLQDAIDASGVREVHVAVGEYIPQRGKSFIMKNGVAIYGGFDPENGITQLQDRLLPAALPSGGNSNGSAGSHLIGNGSRVVTNDFTKESPLDSTAVLDGFVITGGNDVDQGGGIYNNFASPTLTNVEISENKIPPTAYIGFKCGGGIYNNYSSPILMNAVIRRNSVYSSNTFYDARGGGIYNDNSSPILKNVLISENNVDNSGAGMYNRSGSPVLTNVVIRNNRASSSHGGGVYIYEGSPVFMNVEIVHNEASAGGGVYNDNGSPELSNVLIVENWASEGGGVYNRRGLPIITNAAISGNMASSIGGGIVNFGGLSLKNSIVWRNKSSDSQYHSIYGIISPESAYNMIEGGHFSNIPNIPSPPSPLFPPVELDIFEAPYPPNPSYRLKEGSLAIDAGKNSFVKMDKDLAGNARIRNDKVDLGPYEVQKGNNVPLIKHTEGIVYVRPNGTGDGSSWADPSADLQSAIDASGVREVYVAVGEYQPQEGDSFTMKNNVAIYGGFDPDNAITAKEDRILPSGLPSGGNSNGYAGSILKGNGREVIENSFSEYSPLTRTAVLDGFTVTGGKEGGGIFNYFASPMVTNVTISGNVASTYGGGVHNFYSSPVLTNVAISGNVTSHYGGGMYNYSTSTSITTSSPNLINVTITGNSAREGGGMYNNNSSSPVLKNVTIDGNTATSGGGVYNSSSFPMLTNVTISGNTASRGGGIYSTSSSNSKIYNTIIYGNNKDNGSIDNIYNNNSSFELYHSLVQGSGSSGDNWNNDFGTDKGGNMDADPIFTDPANNDFTLQGTSPAINAGQNSFFLNLTDDTKDLGGNPRVYDGLANGIIDLGAYEYQGNRIIPALEAELTGTNVSCYGGSNGIATVTATGGEEPYSYEWSYGNVTTATVSGLPAGDYSVTVTDANGTVVTKTITITQPANPLSISSISPTHVSCHGGANGTATVTATGGTEGYTYQWNTVPVQTTATATHLSAGTYEVTVTDANGCQTTSSIIVTQPDPLNISGTETTNTSFGQANGSATVYVTGGTGAYTYSWNTSPAQSTATTSNLAAGNYTVTITDANNCQITQGFTIGNTFPPVLTTSAGATQFTEVSGKTPVPVAIDSGIVVSDPDNTTLASATISISDGFQTGQDTLLFTNNGSTMSNISASYNSGTGVLTMTSAGATATLAQWQSALRAVAYSNSSKAPKTADRAITFVVHDGTDNSAPATKVVTITDRNDPPVNNVPGPQSVLQNGTLAFNAANNNLISVSDVDAGSNPVVITLTATNGLLRVGATSGLTFIVGTGIDVADMLFTGTLAAINSALNGLVFTPTPGYKGPAHITIVANDGGWTGGGGAKTETDVIQINVLPINPVVTNVSSSNTDKVYKIGDEIILTMTFDQVVEMITTDGVPTLRLETGLTDRHATYVSGSGSNTLSFLYTVQEDDVSADLDYHSTTALSLNGATIRNLYGDNAVLILPTVGSPNSISGQKDITIDGIRPTANIVVQQADLKIGETTTVTFTFSEAVTDLTTTDLAAPNASLSNLSSSDGGVTWTATLTPDADVEEGVNVIILYNTGIMDAAGNTGSGTTESNNYAIDTKAPSTPTGLQVSFGNTQNSLSWTANTETDLASYRIYGGTTPAADQLLQTVTAPTTTYTHTGLTNGTTYFYRMTAVDNVGNESIRSEEVHATPRAPQVITFEALEAKTYGDADFAPGATSTNTANTITYTSSNTAVATIVNGNIQIVGVGTTTITASQVGTAAYKAADDKIQVFEVTPATLTVTANADQQKVYGQDDPVFTYDATGYQLNDDETILSGALTRDAGEDVGSYKVRLGTLTAGDNYNLNFLGNDFDITPATITGITFEDGSFVYEGGSKSLAISGDLPEGVTVSYAGNGQTEAGVYKVTASIDGGTNYENLVLTAGLEIRKALLADIITFEDGSFIYDGRSKSLTIIGDLPDGVTVSYTGNGQTEAGVYEVTATIAGGNNYENLVLTAELEIRNTSLAGVITFEDDSFVYDGRSKSLAIIGDLPDGVTVSYADNGRIDAGQQEVTATLSGAGYEPLVLTAVLTVTPAELRVRASSPSKLFGSADPALEYSVEGLVGGDRKEDQISGTLQRSPGEGKGEYTIGRGSLSAGPNYRLLFEEGTLSVHYGVQLTAGSVSGSVRGDEVLETTWHLRNMWHEAYPAGVELRLEARLGTGLRVESLRSADFDIQPQGDGWILRTKTSWGVSEMRELDVSLIGEGTYAGASSMTLSAWNPSNSSTDADSHQRIDMPVEEGLYTIRASNVFTPNGDGINDAFVFEGLELHDRAELHVLNRFGDEVYRDLDYKNDWTAPNVNDGTYFYVLEVWRYSPIQQRTVKSFFRGSVLIKRK